MVRFLTLRRLNASSKIGTFKSHGMGIYILMNGIESSSNFIAYFLLLFINLFKHRGPPLRGRYDILASQRRVLKGRFPLHRKTLLHESLLDGLPALDYNGTLWT